MTVTSRMLLLRGLLGRLVGNRGTPGLRHPFDPLFKHSHVFLGKVTNHLVHLLADLSMDELEIDLFLFKLQFASKLKRVIILQICNITKQWTGTPIIKRIYSRSR